MPSSALQTGSAYQRADEGIGPYMGFQLEREHPKAPLCKGSLCASPEAPGNLRGIATPVCGLVRNDMRNTKCI